MASQYGTQEIPALFLWVMCILVSAIIGWDTYTETTNQRHLAVSELVYAWSIRWPLLPFAAGMLMGHLFWRKG